MTSANLPLDPRAVRALFPAFAEPDLEGWAFFENAGGSYTAQPVLDRLNAFYTRTKVQPYAPYPASEAGGAAMDLAHERLALALGVTADWIHFGPSTTANTYVLATAVGEWLSAGDAVIVTDQDHEANSGAWRKLAARGIAVREWSADPQTGHLDPEDLYALIDDTVRLVAFPHCSNIVGEINPVADIAARLRAQNIVSVVDGVSYAPHGLPDVAALGTDIYLFSAYKTYGPHQGVMVIRPEINATLPNQGHFFNAGLPRKRMTPAGPDHAQIAASAGIADYLEAVAALAPKTGETNPFRRAAQAMHDQEQVLLAPLMDYLKARTDLRLIGPTDPSRRAPTVSIALDEPGVAAAKRLARHRIMASGGDFYAYRLMQRLGLAPETGVLRVSFVHYTTPGEVDRLIAALDAEL
ncbi:aminotransferase class V-fold PLP-dependent enzyme [Pelagibacterium xiamenense]|uniref:aminotransferase class V-fold PLP-dependent enzyme n=1 Tax=Pelagibacterium xiamenense TaxID=2901140 RepID=UPI001E5D1C20|nr:aminotransferase class V-fold PLP-dependent enzyme [Pelagibacterium xiamenense]MCD7060252.1 aminotransferase class V-fold PLP-dependent enzyme [Pelagibacterium xiamenense]